METSETGFFSYPLVSSEILELKVSGLFYILAVIGLYILLNFYSKRLIHRTKLFSRIDKGIRRSVLLFLRVFYLFSATIAILEILGLEITKVLRFELIHWKDVVVTPNLLLLSAIIIILTGLFLQLVSRSIDRLVAINRLDKQKGSTVKQLLKYIIWVVAVIIILQIFGINLTLLLGASAALLVGFGLGLQQIFSDLISGIFILFEGNLKVEDVVELEDGTIGRVLETGVRTSKILTRDNVIIIVPNSQIIQNQLINWSHVESRTRFSVNVGVAYGSDVHLVKEVLLECAKEHNDITHDPASFVRFNDFGESSLDFQLYFWTNKSFLVENIKSDLRFQIDQKFRDKGVEIPFPQRDVHIRSSYEEKA